MPSPPHLQDSEGRDVERAVRAQLFGTDAVAEAATNPTTEGSPAGDLTLTRGDVLGRYVLLDRLGAGGMGVVHSAFDPELDRKVALKLLLPSARDADDGRVRLLREAQALARLAHPNVVTVHDVGTHDDRVWIAMEFVPGWTFGAWLRERVREWPEVLGVLTDVARGVAAAHAAHLVHRDLKPDNVMIGRDGRVRVMDFGLAHGRSAVAAARELVATLRSSTPDEQALAGTLPADLDASGEPSQRAALAQQLTRAGAVQGTPAYMAPEQWHGREAEAATDQFGWCVMAWEALYGERPFAGATLPALAATVTAGQRRPPPRGRRVPRWLRRALERGLATRPADRWPSMDALLAAVAGGRARTRRRIAVAVVVAVVVVVLAVLGGQRIDRAQRVAACTADAAAIAEVWNPGAQTALRAALIDSGAAYAVTTADLLATWIDGWTAEWSEIRGSECRAARVDEARAPAHAEAASACLAEHRDKLAALIAAITEDGVRGVRRAMPATSDLGRPATCADPVALAHWPRLPEDPEVRAGVAAVRRGLTHAGAIYALGRYEEGRQEAERLVAEAEAVGHTPLIAEAQLMLASQAAAGDRLEQAEAAATRAYVLAGTSGDDDLAARAGLELMNVLGYLQSRPREGRLWAHPTGVLIERSGQRDDLIGARYLNALGEIDRLAGDLPAARRHHEQALEIRRHILGDRHLAVALSLNNLAAVQQAQEQHEEALTGLSEALAIREGVLGPEHPVVATTLGNLGLVYTRLKDHARAQALYERALQIRERSLGPTHALVAEAHNDMAAAYEGRGDLDGMEFHLTKAREILERANGPEHPDVAMILANLGEVRRKRGDLDGARDLLERAVAVWEATLGADHPLLAYPLIGLGQIDTDRRRGAEAIPLFERAVSVRTSATSRTDERAQAQLLLAGALWDFGAPADRPRARALAEEARRLVADRHPEARNEVDAWLAEHPR